jgi:hypothetical protein
LSAEALNQKASSHRVGLTAREIHANKDFATKRFRGTLRALRDSHLKGKREVKMALRLFSRISKFFLLSVSMISLRLRNF